VFRHEGDFWTVVYGGTSVRLRHGKGLCDIAALLANPGREIHVADLIAASAIALPDPRSAPAGEASTAELAAQGLHVSPATSGATFEPAHTASTSCPTSRCAGASDAPAPGLGRRSEPRVHPRFWQIATWFLAPPSQGPPPDRRSPRRQGGYANEIRTMFG